jgi:hypothetical protein
VFRHSADDILAVLDEGARGFVFPMLDNGCVYPAAARLALYRSARDWALVFEIVGYTPRAFEPDLTVISFGSGIVRTGVDGRFPDRQARQAYIGQNPNEEVSIFHPIESDDWIGEEDVAAGAAALLLRGETVPLPGDVTYAAAGVERQNSGRTNIFELCRALAFERRDAVLATESERRTHLSTDMERLMLLDEWHHPDLAAGALPSSSETFRQLAEVLAAGDRALYRPTLPSNTHWSHWPDGGAL